MGIANVVIFIQGSSSSIMERNWMRRDANSGTLRKGSINGRANDRRNSWPPPKFNSRGHLRDPTLFVNFENEENTIQHMKTRLVF
jgi:hypothetical protein